MFKSYFGNLLVKVIKRNKPLLAKLLIYLGVDATFRNNRPVKWAAYNGMTEIMLLLIKKGADIKVDEGYCLLCAASNHHEHTVYEILYLAYKNEEVVNVALLNAEDEGFCRSARVASIIRDHLARQ